MFPQDLTHLLQGPHYQHWSSSLSDASKGTTYNFLSALRRQKIRQYGHARMSTRFAKTILQGTVQRDRRTASGSGQASHSAGGRQWLWAGWDGGRRPQQSQRLQDMNWTDAHSNGIHGNSGASLCVWFSALTLNPANYSCSTSALYIYLIQLVYSVSLHVLSWSFPVSLYTCLTSLMLCTQFVFLSFTDSACVLSLSFSHSLIQPVCSVYLIQTVYSSHFSPCAQFTSSACVLSLSFSHSLIQPVCSVYLIQPVYSVYLILAHVLSLSHQPVCSVFRISACVLSLSYSASELSWSHSASELSWSHSACVLSLSHSDCELSLSHSACVLSQLFISFSLCSWSTLHLNQPVFSVSLLACVSSWLFLDQPVYLVCLIQPVHPVYLISASVLSISFHPVYSVYLIHLVYSVCPIQSVYSVYLIHLVYPVCPIQSVYRYSVYLIHLVYPVCPIQSVYRYSVYLIHLVYPICPIQSVYSVYLILPVYPVCPIQSVYRYSVYLIHPVYSVCPIQSVYRYSVYLIHPVYPVCPIQSVYRYSVYLIHPVYSVCPIHWFSLCTGTQFISTSLQLCRAKMLGGLRNWSWTEQSTAALKERGLEDASGLHATLQGQNSLCSTRLTLLLFQMQPNEANEWQDRVRMDLTECYNANLIRNKKLESLSV